MAFDTMLTAERVGRHTADGYWRDRVITDFLDSRAAEAPGKTAFTDPRRSVTYEQLRDLTDRAALALLDLGVGKGDVVSFQLPNWIEFIALHLAATRIGAVSNPLIPIYREREVGFMVGLARSKVIVVPREFRGFDYPAMVAKLRPGWPDLAHVIVVDAQGEQGGGEPPGTLSWDTFIARDTPSAADRAALARQRPDPNDVTLLIFTSGTTGEPKGVMHTHNTLVAANDPIPGRLGVSDASVIHMASTMAHLTGFLYGARLPVQNGASCVLQDVWDAARFAELAETHGITYTSAATPFLHDLVNEPSLAGRDLSSLKLFCCMGAPIPRVIVREAREKLPGLTVLGGWGQTEDALVTLGIPGDPDEKLIDTDGYPWPGMELRVLDDAGEPTPAGVAGRLQVRGPFLFVGYAERISATRASFDGDWFDTGDLASIDADGYLTLSGRTKDVIIRGGENIPVAYVENVLHEHPDVDAVAVVGVPDPRLQERACACVVPRPGAGGFTLEAMREFLRAKGVAKPYWPERLEILDDLPRTPSGKIQKFRLRERLS